MSEPIAGPPDSPMIDDQGRPEPPPTADEVTTLLAYLDYQRATFDWKVAGLTEDQLAVTIAASTMTLGGMIKHLACVEDFWVTAVVGGSAMPAPWSEADWDSQPDWDWDSAAEDSAQALLELRRAAVDRSRAVVADRLATGEGFDGIHPTPGGRGRVSLRWVVVHLIEEYARHNGHADLLREAIDGQTGE